MHRSIEKIDTPDAPKAIGPYSQATVAGGFVFVSGQLPIDPKVGKIVDFTIQGQTRRVLENIEAILRAEGLDLTDVVRSEVFLKDMNDFSAMNAVYSEKFSHSIKPARYAFQIARLPMDALVEIACIAMKKSI